MKNRSLYKTECLLPSSKEKCQKFAGKLIDLEYILVIKAIQSQKGITECSLVSVVEPIIPSPYVKQCACMYIQQEGKRTRKTKYGNEEE